MTGDLAQRSRAALGSSGELVQALPNFTPRLAQQDLAAAIADAIEDSAELVSEAGTGTGKTFAYLVPVILSGRKAILSTGTKALQDQLHQRDLPRVREALGVGFRSALLKGRANYLCLHRLNTANQRDLFASPAEVQQFGAIRTWAKRTQYGDFNELSSIPEGARILSQVSSTADSCLGTDCEFYEDCFVVKARQRALAADVVVVNHHLLLADLSLKDTGMGQVLPDAQVFVIDEAHQLPELAGQFLGSVVSGNAVAEVGRDAIREAEQASGTLALIRPRVDGVLAALRQARKRMDGLPAKGPREAFVQWPQASEGLDELKEALVGLLEQLQAVADQTPGLLRCSERCQDHLDTLADWTGAQRTNGVYWFELGQHSFRLRYTPMDVSDSLRSQREQTQASWIMTSATLAVDTSFTHYTEKMGMDEPRTLIAPSPFNWNEQSLLYVPPNLPDPSDRDFMPAVIDAIRPVLEASKGRAFLLFASHANLRKAHALLKDGPWPLFVQGEGAKNALLDGFRKSGNGVLLGTATFREGVDVVGDALSVVVIDKLPFAPPDDPVLVARQQDIRNRGGNPFADEQVPQAVIATKQAAGRLIRSETDRGVLVIADPRLLGKSYGRRFIQSLPAMRLTRQVQDVQEFFNESNSGD